MSAEETRGLPLPRESEGVQAARQRPSLTLNAIHHRAYRKWEAAGMPEGDCVRFWLEAEQELRQGE
jgi:hypothetical protein